MGLPRTVFAGSGRAQGEKYLEPGRGHEQLHCGKPNTFLFLPVLTTTYVHVLLVWYNGMYVHCVKVVPILVYSSIIQMA